MVRGNSFCPLWYKMYQLLDDFFAMSFMPQKAGVACLRIKDELAKTKLGSQRSYATLGA